MAMATALTVAVIMWTQTITMRIVRLAAVMADVPLVTVPER